MKNTAAVRVVPDVSKDSAEGRTSVIQDLRIEFHEGLGTLRSKQHT